MESGVVECTVARRDPARHLEKNALKHGLFTREQRAERQRVQELLRQSRKLLVDIMMSEPKNVAIGFVL